MGRAPVIDLALGDRSLQVRLVSNQHDWGPLRIGTINELNQQLVPFVKFPERFVL